MRILHVATRHRRGGAERNLLHTALWESRHGHEVHLAVGRDSLPTDTPPDLTVHVIPSLARAVSPVDDLSAYRAIRRLVRENAFDLVHTHQSKAGIIGRLAARNRVSAIVHTIHMASFGPTYGAVGSATFVRAERYCAGFTDAIVSVGDELRRLYLDAGVGRPEQYSVIRSPIDIAAFAAVRELSSDARAAARARLGLRPEGKLAVVAASLEPRKRVDLVLRELAGALRSGELDLAIAGDGPARDALLLLARTLGVADRVHSLGHVEDMPGLFSGADVLVHAATVEGVPQVTLQALAAGLPVVATEMIGLREVEGAPIRIVPSAGTGLAEAVTDALQQPQAPVLLDALDPWTPAGVDDALQALHTRLRGLPAAGRLG